MLEPDTVRSCRISVGLLASLTILVGQFVHPQTTPDSNAPPAPVVQAITVESSSSAWVEWTVDRNPAVSDQEITESRISWQVVGQSSTDSLTIPFDGRHCTDIQNLPVACAATITGLQANTTYEFSISAHGITRDSNDEVDQDYGFGNASSAIQRHTHAKFELDSKLLTGSEHQVRIPFLKIIAGNAGSSAAARSALFTFVSDRAQEANTHRWEYSASVSIADTVRTIVVVDFDSLVEDDLFRIIGTYVSGAEEEREVSVRVTAELKGSNPAIRATRDIAFTVIKNRAPKFDVTKATFRMPEDEPYTIHVGENFRVSDADGHALTYQLTTVEPEESVFQIDEATGVIDLQEGKSLDFETASRHVLHVTALDSLEVKSNTLVITVNITDGNEPPKSTPISNVVLAHQNMRIDQEWVTFLVRKYFYDPDGDPLCYTAEILEGADYATLYIPDARSDCGHPTIQVRRVDKLGLFEVKEVKVRVTATEDKEENPGSATGDLTVSIIYGQNTAPRILGGRLTSSSPNSGYSLSHTINENTRFDMVFTAQDSLPAGDRVCFSLGGKDADEFKLIHLADPQKSVNCGARGSNSTPGSLRFSHQIRVQSKEVLDYERHDGAYSVDVIATDLSGDQGKLPFEIATRNEQEGIQTIEFPDLHFVVGDDAKTYELRDFFYDEDNKNETLEYSVESGDTSLVTVSESNGVLTVTPTSEEFTQSSRSTYIVIEARTTSGNAASQRVNVRLKRNNRSPRFDLAAVGFEIAEDFKVGEMFGTEQSATDPDGDTVVYRLENHDSPFRAARTTGRLIVRDDKLDYETQAKYELVLVADDQYGGTDRLTITVDILDVNEQPVATAKVLADVATLVGVGLADKLNGQDHFRDADVNDSSLLISATSDNTQIASAGANSEGYVSVRGIRPGETTITVTARDSGNPPLSAQKSFRLTVNRNSSPALDNELSNFDLQWNSKQEIDLSSVFTDEPEDTLTFAAETNDDTIATGTIDGETLIVRARGEGTARITVTATDLAKNTASVAFNVTVTVNSPPVRVETIEDVVIRLGEPTVEISLAGVFEDEGDTFTLRTHTSDADVAVASVLSDSETLRITGYAVGKVQGTVVATDSGGGTTETEFLISVLEPNDPPRVAMPIDDLEISLSSVSQYVDINLDDLFEDEHPDELELTVNVSSDEFADVFIRSGGSVIRIYPAKVGSFEISITAEDDIGQTATYQFTVEVTDDSSNSEPVVVASIADQTVNAGERVVIDLSPVFSDEDGDELVYAAVSNDEDVVTTQIVQNDMLRVYGEAAGSTTVSVTATDPSGASITTNFSVTVETAPASVGTMANLTLQLGADPVSINLADSFVDGDGDPLQYRARSSNTDVVEISQLGSVLTLASVSRGNSTITVSATDPSNRSASQQFTVTVSSEALKASAEKALAGYGRSILGTVSSAIGDRLNNKRKESGFDLRSIASGLDIAHATNPIFGHGRNVDGGRPSFESVQSNLVHPSATPSFAQEELFTFSATPTPQWNRQNVSRDRQPLMLWSHSDFQIFGDSTNAGQAKTRFLGLEFQSTSDSLWGAALMQSGSTTQYSYGTKHESLKTSLLSIVPYFNYQFNEDYRIWAALAMGTGRVSVNNADVQLDQSPLALKLGIVGIQKSLWRNEIGQLGLKTDLGSVILQTNNGPGAADGLGINVHRMRIGLNASYSTAPVFGFTVTPYGELALRQDLGDGATGTGLEVDGGMRLVGKHMTIDAQGRALAVHTQKSLVDRGFSLEIHYDLMMDGSGFTLSMQPQIGCAASSKSVWSESTALTQLKQPSSDCARNTSLATTIGYGTFILQDRVRFVPQAQIATSNYGARSVSIGARMDAKLASSRSANVSLMLGRSSHATPKQGVNEISLTTLIRF